MPKPLKIGERVRVKAPGHPRHGQEGVLTLDHQFSWGWYVNFGDDKTDDDFFEGELEPLPLETDCATCGKTNDAGKVCWWCGTDPKPHGPFVRPTAPPDFGT